MRNMLLGVSMLVKIACLALLFNYLNRLDRRS
jgi:hypothetical protein